MRISQPTFEVVSQTPAGHRNKHLACPIHVHSIVKLAPRLVDQGLQLVAQSFMRPFEHPPHCRRGRAGVSDAQPKRTSTHRQVVLLIPPAQVQVVPRIREPSRMAQQHPGCYRDSAYKPCCAFAPTSPYLAFRVVVSCSVESTMMSGSASAGTHCPTGASKSRPPFSTKCMIAIAVTILLQENIAKIYCSVCKQAYACDDSLRPRPSPLADRQY